MSKVLRIVSAEAVVLGVLKIAAWNVSILGLALMLVRLVA